MVSEYCVLGPMSHVTFGFLYSVVGNDSVLSAADYRHLLERLGVVGDVACQALTITRELDTTDVERLLHE
ncbi:hypothetical protein ANCDUO_01948 [Ancylostoma duodenale]|uniref:Uncharacterized protein n=1 Tax=Ancylostoma duodenale TaxID=51022 RepID=A0A0C2DCY8_9BILA|nr:hypothetical protein ANCDUO_01948 [Ancylostoma duodenale]